MKISWEQTEHSIEYLRQTPPPNKPLQPVGEVSEAEVESVMTAWDGNDEVRSAMVQELSHELSADVYVVPSDWVAEKLVGRLVSDRLR